MMHHERERGTFQTSPKRNRGTYSYTVRHPSLALRARVETASTQASEWEHVSRRSFLQTTVGAAVGGCALPGTTFAKTMSNKRPKIAAVYTEFRERSHAYHILEAHMGPYLFNGRLTDPGVDVVSFYADQFPENDMTRDVAHRCAVPLFDSIDGALCLGGRELAVDGVLLIGEHGDYPMNELGQRMYPRKEFFDRIVAVMRRSNRFVPIFNDKHLSYRWDWAKEMYDTARELGIPMMAGSSVPLAQRRPLMETPVGAELTEAVSIHGGPMESYDFHGLEVLQSIVEFRHGGERGVTQVQLLSGDEMLRAARAGQWSVALAETAMRAELGDQFHSLEDDPTRLQHGILLKYADGLRGAILAVGSNANRWNFACQVRAEPATRATAFFAGPWGNRNLFRALSHAIQHMLVTGQPAYPVERTLLTTGVLEASMRSHHQGNVPIETPHLELAYEPIDFAAMREMGASWKILTEDVPMPPVFEPGDKQTLQRARR